MLVFGLLRGCKYHQGGTEKVISIETPLSGQLETLVGLGVQAVHPKGACNRLRILEFRRIFPVPAPRSSLPSPTPSPSPLLPLVGVGAPAGLGVGGWVWGWGKKENKEQF